MPSKKNQQNKPNGYILYANEIKNQLLKEGHVIRSTQDLIHAACEKWQALPADEKEYYKEKAKWEWDNRHITGKYQARTKAKVYDNTGAPISKRVDLARVTESRREKERQEVFMSFLPDLGVLEQKFYFVSFICLLEEPAFQPIEVAAVEFSLLKGRERTWHKHIHPGQIPQGYYYKAQQTSELTHKLPLEGKMDPRDSYTKIYDELFDFLSRGTRHIPPIHVKISDCERVKECLNWLAQNAGRPNHLKRVYELEGLMLDLDSHLNGEPQNLMQMKQPATDILNTSVFDWDRGTKCKYHEDEDNDTVTKHCALGYVNRYCFCLSDYFCNTHNITITDNHLPPKQNDVCYTFIPSKDTKKNRQQQRFHQSQSAPELLNQGREDLARQVAEKLRLEQESQTLFAHQVEDEDRAAKQREEEQQKRWASIRGSPNKSDSHNRNSNDKVLNNDYIPIGRGRGRGLNAMNNLRRPGEKFVSPTKDDNEQRKVVSPPPGFTGVPGLGTMRTGKGRGTKLHMNTAEDRNGDDDQRFAGATSAPSAKDAPRPPRAWMS